MRIYEPSPTGGASTLLRNECRDYVPSVYRGPSAGQAVTGERSENVESLSFANGEFDIVVSQDILEHVFEPEAAVREIARVLRPGGLHVFTIPLKAHLAHTRRRAKWEAGEIVHLLEPEYHEDPFSELGALVTIDWGADVAATIDEWAPNMTTEMHEVRTRRRTSEPPVWVFLSRKIRA